MHYDLKEILDIPKLQKIMDNLFKSTNIVTAILDLDGNILTASGWQDICTQFHRKKAASATACTKSDTHFYKQLNKDTPYVIYECPHGLIDAATPIIIENNHVGNIFTGQLLLQEKDEALRQTFALQARQFGYNEQEYLKALEKVPVFKKEKVESILDFLHELARFIGEKGLVQLRLNKMNTRLEKKVDRDQARYQRLIEGSHDIFYSFTKSKGGFFVSRKIKEILGYEAQYLRNNPFVWYNSIHPEDKSLVDQAIAEFEEGKFFSIEYRIKDKWGKWHIFQDRSIGSGDIDDDVVIEGMVSDITLSRKKDQILMEEREKFLRLLELLPAFVYLQDDQYKIRYSNRAFRKLFGNKTEGKICYKTIAGRNSPCDPCPTFKVFKTKTPLEWEWTSANGEIFQVFDYPYIDTNGEFMVLEMGINISERKAFEKELKRIAEELKQSNRELEQFAYIASHDLQEPLRKIVNFLDLFEAQFVDLKDEKAQRYIWYVTDAARRMSELINDLLSYSRIGREDVIYEEVDTKAVLENVLSDLAILIEKSGAEISHTPLPNIKFNQLQLRRILQNLISNAIKFTKDRRPIIQISAQENEKEWTFLVKDNGMGIDEHNRDRVFAIFQRLHDRSIQGTGIGLAICKKIIERYKGSINFKSETAKGSTFFFSIPKKEVNHERSASH